jgi:anti-sigma B factor antagonist
MGFHPGDLFGIQVDCRNGVARLALRGELDMATARKLEEHLMVVEQDGVGAVLIDLRDLTFVDSTGLHTFLKAKSRAADNGHRFALVGANGQLKRILEVTATQEEFDEQEGVRLLAQFTRSSPRTSVDAEWSSDG